MIRFYGFLILVTCVYIKGAICVGRKEYRQQHLLTNTTTTNNMKFSFTFGALALFLAVAAADHGASAGGNNNEGDVSGLVRIKSHLLYVLIC